MKTCNHCAVEKPLDDFSRHPLTKDRRAGICRVCDNARRRENSLRNKEREKATQAAAYQRNKEVRKANAREQYWTNHEHCLKRKRAYNKSHRAQQNARQRVRRNIKRAAMTGDTRLLQLVYLFVKQAPVLWCEYCNHPVPVDKRHVDHRTPLIRGGPHSVSNLAVSCAVCNMSKHTQTAEEFMEVTYV